MSTMTLIDHQALFSEVCQAWNRGDAATLAAHYAEDGRLITPFGDALPGRGAIASGFAQLFAGPLAGTGTEVVVEGVRNLTSDLAIIDGTQTITGPMPPLHFTAVVRRIGDTAEILECRPYAFLPRPSRADHSLIPGPA